MIVKSTGSREGGSSRGSLFFADFFDGRGDQPWFLGDGWLTCMLAGNPSPGNGPIVSGVYNVGSGIAGMGSSGSNGQSILMSIPWPMDLGTLSGLPQFAEYKMRTNNSIVGSLDRRGPMVFAKANQGNCYCLEINWEAATVNIFRINQSNVSTTILGTTFPIALNDTIRIEAINSDPLNIVINAYRNGVLQQSVTDSSAQRLVSGLPGIYDAFCSSGITQTLSNFACGAL